MFIAYLKLHMSFKLYTWAPSQTCTNVYCKRDNHTFKNPRRRKDTSVSAFLWEPKIQAQRNKNYLISSQASFWKLISRREIKDEEKEKKRKEEKRRKKNYAIYVPQNLMKRSYLGKQQQQKNNNKATTSTNIPKKPLRTDVKYMKYLDVLHRENILLIDNTILYGASFHSTRPHIFLSFLNNRGT